jgi:DNA modification methylase
MNNNEYAQFLEKKQQHQVTVGFDAENLSEKLFDYQKAIVTWAVKRGRAAIFADTGMGKSFMQSAWAGAVYNYTNKNVLILAPLCVAPQTVKEAAKLGVNIKYVREPQQETGIYITNYEMMDAFEDQIKQGLFSAIVLDESSILKHQDSKTRSKIIDLCKDIPYRLSCTATPSPNDFMELGSQAEFLGLMTSMEMLAMFFTHDSSETSKWRLKGHGRSKFWEWLATWSVLIKKPSDLGFSDKGYDLPPLNIDHVKIEGDLVIEDTGLKARNLAKKLTVDERVAACAEMVNKTTGSIIVWCHRNEEGQKLRELIPDAIEVSGADDIDEKEEKLDLFTNGKARVLITKPKIAGFGMNWQHCNQMYFVGLSDSYEQIYQAIRRCWRFGQTKPVDVFMVAHSAEGQVLENIKRKEDQANEMTREMISFMREFQEKEVKQLVRDVAIYKRDVIKKDNFELHLSDCVDLVKELPDESIDYSIFSPPFASLYTYSNSDRDMGNSKDYNEFWHHFKFMVKELHRAMASGRNVSVHCMNLPTSKVRDGYIGIRDFRGDIIRCFQEAGFVYHSEVAIWKDPVVAMQRTKALGLLWKQIKKDSSMNRQGLPDYVVTFRKLGVNKKPISHTPEEFGVDKWQHYASPVWFDIKQSNTLNGRMAREEEDERHICPLQLDLIERCLDLWSAKGDTVFSPFTGIGSEGVVSLAMGRKFIGSELKESYFKIASENLANAHNFKLESKKFDFDARSAAVNFHKRKEKKKEVEIEEPTEYAEVLENQLSLI